MLGALITLGGIGNFIGAWSSEKLVERFPLGKVLIGTHVLAGSMWLLIPMAHGPWYMAASFLGASQLFGDIAYPIYDIHELTLRQSVTPTRSAGPRERKHADAVQGLLAAGRDRRRPHRAALWRPIHLDAGCAGDFRVVAMADVFAGAGIERTCAQIVAQGCRRVCGRPAGCPPGIGKKPQLPAKGRRGHALPALPSATETS